MTMGHGKPSRSTSSTLLLFFLHDSLSSGKTSGVVRVKHVTIYLGQERELLIIEAESSRMSIFQLPPAPPEIRALCESRRGYT